MQRNAPLRSAKLQLLTEVLLSLNLALVLSYYYLVRSFIDASDSKGTSSAYTFLYYFFRAAVRVNRLLHYQPPGYEKYVRWPNAGGSLGVELAFALTTVFLGVLFLAVLRLARSFHNYKNVLRFFGGLVFLFAFPLTCVLFARSFSFNPTLASAFPVAIPELVCVAVLCLIYLLRPFTTWGMGIVLLLHYCFWALAFHGNGTNDTMYGPIPHRLLLLLIPTGGAIWLYYCQALRRHPPIELSGKLRSKQVIVAVTVSVAGLGALWLPGRGYNLVHAKNRDSLTIEMWHSNCQIGCPVYKITVHGNGAVEYVGEQFVKVHGAQASSLNEEQMQSILVGFDRADFFSLEDQAFAWGYHSAKVNVRISVDGKTKEVSSDMYHIGAKSGLQAKFVEAAANLDRVIGTARWVSCDEPRCPL